MCYPYQNAQGVYHMTGSGIQKISFFSTLMIILLSPSQTLFAAETAGIKPINQHKLQTLVDKTANDLLVPAAFVLLRTPQGEFFISHGTTKINTSTSPDKNTHFRIASNTKTMTAAVIVQQAQEGKINFSDPVSKFLPNIPNGENITIADLLDMRSGLANYTECPKIAASLDHHEDKTWTANELLAIAFAVPPLSKPDTVYHYCNTNYLLLGLIAEIIDHQPLADILQKRIFKPMSMSNTLLPNSNKLPSPYSHGYQYGSAVYALIDKPYPKQIQLDAESGKLKPVDYTFQNPSYALAAGGAISTAENLADWIENLVSGKLFNKKYYHYWLNSLKPEDESNRQQYGYGITKMQFGPNQIYFHGGEMPGYNSFIGYDKDNKVTLIVWTSLAISVDGQLTANALMVKILDAIYVVSPLKGSASHA